MDLLRLTVRLYLHRRAKRGIPVCADSRMAKISDRPGTKVLVFPSNIVYSPLSYTMRIDDNSYKNKYA